MMRLRSIWHSSIALVLMALAVTPRAFSEQKAFAEELKKEWPLSLPKGSTVIVKIPPQFWQEEAERRKDLKIELPFKEERDVTGPSRAYFVEVSDVLSQPAWARSGFPLCAEFTLSRIFWFKSFTMHHKLPYTEVELRNSAMYLRLHFADSGQESLNAEFQKVVARGDWHDFENSDEFQNNVFAVQEKNIFKGALANLSDTVKLSLMDMACKSGNAFETGTFKGKTYFGVTLGSDTQVYNSNVLSSSARLAHVINDRIIPVVKTFKSPAAQIGIDELKFRAKVYYRNFVDESKSHRDDVEIYLPLDLCLKFSEADITSQQLVDGGIVLLNGDRVEIPLSTGR